MRYTLKRNPLARKKTDACIARPVAAKVKTREDLIADLTKEGSILKDTECNAVLDGFMTKLTEYASQGITYRDDLFEMHTEIQGLFDNEDDRFDPKRHKVAVRLNPEQALRSAVTKLKPRFKKITRKQPILKKIYDWGSSTQNALLTPQSYLDIKGEELKIYEIIDGQGVFFVHIDTGTEMQAQIIRNQPQYLLLQIPSLTAGRYRIEVRNSTRDGKILRRGISSVVFTVE